MPALVEYRVIENVAEITMNRAPVNAIDHQLARQWEKLAELQQIQIDLLEEAVRARGGA